MRPIPRPLLLHKTAKLAPIDCTLALVRSGIDLMLGYVDKGGQLASEGGLVGVGRLEQMVGDFLADVIAGVVDGNITYIFEGQLDVVQIHGSGRGLLFRLLGFWRVSILWIGVVVVSVGTLFAGFAFAYA